jgi:uncharacterized membrane protein YidH (DUF202 family)
LWLPSYTSLEIRNSMKIVGILLILAGIGVLAYGGFTYTTHKKAVDMGPVQIETSKRHNVYLPPLLGATGIVLGGVLLFVSSKSR